MGTKGTPVWIFSTGLNILSLLRMAYAMLNGAGRLFGNVNLVNSPG